MKKMYLFVLLSLPCLFANAQQGIPDVTFDNDGYFFIIRPGTNVNTGYALAIQPDGKILTAGIGQFGNWNWFKITRHNTNGSLDNTFGNNGIIYINPAENPTDGSVSPAYGIALQPDGKIIVTGSHQGYHDFQASDFSTPVIRLNTNGTLDNTFDGNGILSLQLLSPSITQGASDVALQADGKIVVAGYTYIGGVLTMTIARVTSTGTPDNAFGGSGIVYVTNFPSGSQGYGVKIQANGKIVVAGRAVNGASGNDMVVVRLNTDGSFDNSFDGDGIATVDFNNTDDFAYDLDLQPDGKIVLSGSTQGITKDLAFVRLTNSGQPDNSFNGTGKKTLDLGVDESLNSMVVQPDGKLLFGGTKGSLSNNSARIVVVKLNPDGSPDNNYDGDGIGLYDFLGGTVSSEDIALQADGKIVSVGFGAGPGYPGGRVVARFTNTVAAPGPLPVVLTNFEVQAAKQNAILKWQTASEQNSDHFDVLHSINGRDFKSLGQVRAGGNSTDLTNYQFIHSTPVNGWNYYQLLMKDIDGKFSYSEIRKVNFAGDALITITPNPATKVIRVNHSMVEAKEIEVLDMYGRRVWQTTNKGAAATIINTGSLAPGLYTVVVIHPGGKSTARFIRE